MIEVLQDTTPEDLGFDPMQFPVYRDIQLEALEQAAYGDKRFQVLCMPTGSGKSLFAASIQKLTQWRTAITTPIKGHQDQYERSFASVGLCDIRGKANYQCADQQNLTCRDGQRVGCRYFARDGNSACTYDQVKRKAKTRDLVSANFSYWLNVYDKANGIEKSDSDGVPNPFECLIVDEAHLAPFVLADYLAIRLYESELKDLLGIEGLRGKDADNISEWRKFAIAQYQDADLQLENMERILLVRGSAASRKELEHAARLESLVGKLEKIKTISEIDWVCEYREGTRYGRSWEFDVVWPGKYSESYLFLGIPRVILMSATIRPKTMALLGVRKDDYDFHEWPRVFAANRNPVYYCPAKSEDGKAIQMKYNTEERDLSAWVAWIDHILDERNDRKGIVHTVSYQRQEYLLRHSRHRQDMLGNTADPDSGTAADVCESFREAEAPCILVSPSFGTGWDFPMTECEFIIVAKIPFPNGQSKIMKARKERDDSYPFYIAMQELVQSCGRGMRSEKDRCEVFIVDGALGWFLYQNKPLAPRWFANGVRTVSDVPARPEKLLK